MSSTLMLYCGGKAASREDISAVPLPAQTETYWPVGHAALIDKVIEVTQDVLPVSLHTEAFGLARDGKHLFSLLTFSNGVANKEMALSVGIVNSYDKSLPVKIAAGSSVFVCDNLMIVGHITYMRKHTTNVWDDVAAAIHDRIEEADTAFTEAIKVAGNLRGIPITDTQAYQFLGSLYGRRVLGNQMLTTARREWETPTYPDFKPRNAWSLYNAVNSALKQAQPKDIMEKHRQLHQLLTGADFQWKPDYVGGLN